MKLAARLTNERGNAKVMAEDIRVEVELTYGNKIIGKLGLYSVIDGSESIGYRVIWDNGRGWSENQTIEDSTTGKTTGYKGK